MVPSVEAWTRVREDGVKPNSRRSMMTRAARSRIAFIARRPFVILRNANRGPPVAGRRIQESSESKKKTVAIEAEKNRRGELERSFNGIEDTRQDRIQSIQEIADRYLEAYKLRHRAPVFAEYAVGHVARLLGKRMKSTINDKAVIEYQNARLKEKAAPKTINEETGFLLRMLEDQGDVIRARMKRRHTLKLETGPSIAVAFTDDQKVAMLTEARRRKGSPSVYPALVLALHCGLRDKETRSLRWSHIDLIKGLVTVRNQTKTEAGTGRTVPMNDEVLQALKQHAGWYLSAFGETRPEWFLFPYGRPRPHDPGRSITSFKTVWTSIRNACGITGRWHDVRHTFVTDLLENPDVSDQTVMDMAGHVSQQMLKHYNHTRTEAKRRAVAGLERRAKESTKVTAQN